MVEAEEGQALLVVLCHTHQFHTIQSQAVTRITKMTHPFW